MLFPLMPQGDAINGGVVSKITITLEVSDELARAVAIKNGGRGMAQNHEVFAWAEETLEVAMEQLIDELRQEEEENA